MKISENPFALPVHRLLREHNVKFYTVAARAGISLARLKNYLYGESMAPCHVQRILDEIQAELEAKQEGKE